MHFQRTIELSTKKISKTTNCLPYRREKMTIYCFSSLFTVVSLQIETNALFSYKNYENFLNGYLIAALEKHFILIY